MNFGYFPKRLADNTKVIQGLVQGVSDEQAVWRPEPDEWSILEVINHLYDEERLDFRLRVDYTLHHPEEPWPMFDATGQVIEGRYNERDLTDSIKNFLRERLKSMQWLEGIRDPQWQAVHVHPQLGELCAGDIMVSWLAHDYYHIRQLSNLHLAYTKLQAEPYSTDYAVGR